MLHRPVDEALKLRQQEQQRQFEIRQLELQETMEKQRQMEADLLAQKRLLEQQQLQVALRELQLQQQDSDPQPNETAKGGTFAEVCVVIILWHTTVAFPTSIDVFNFCFPARASQTPSCCITSTTGN